ncbi:MAG TPA: hypothetical protein VF457_02340 [Burkholderiaceae bacterium]
MTRTLDDTTRASSPGGLALSHRKLRQLQPELLQPLRWLFVDKRLIAGHKKGRKYLLTHVTEHLTHGDSRAALVVSTTPLRVAAYSDDLDCVVLLAFPQAFVKRHGLQPGRRLLTVNTYARREHGVGRDLVEGPDASGVWGDFAPYVAEFLSDDLARIEQRKAQIDEFEWARCQGLASDWLARHGQLARDGRPLHCGLPAHLR